jgi:hypothetical protein
MSNFVYLFSKNRLLSLQGLGEVNRCFFLYTNQNKPDWKNCTYSGLN